MYDKIKLSYWKSFNPNKFVNLNNNVFFGQNAFNHHALNIPNGGFIRA